MHLSPSGDNFLLVSFCIFITIYYMHIIQQQTQQKKQAEAKTIFD